MATRTFSAPLERLPVEALWTILVAPFSVYEVFGQKDIVPVRGTLNGQPFRASLRPLLPEFRSTQRPLDGDCHFIMVNRKMREAAGLKVGEAVQVVLDLDTEERTVDAPPDLAAAFSAQAAAGAAYEKLSKSRRYEFVSWLNGTKNPDTRQKRIAGILEMLAAGTTPRTRVKKDKGA
jgi:hypothetical protein